MRWLVLVSGVLAAACGRFGFDDAPDAPAIDAGLGALVQTSLLKASNPGVSDFFGQGVALSADGTTLAISARWEDSGVVGNELDNSAFNAGAVYVFERTGAGWSQQAYLKASDPASPNELGVDLVISADGTTLVATAWGDGGAAGAAYVFVRTNDVWSEQAKLVASDRAGSAYFGSAAALSGDGNTLALGAYNGNGMRGSAYVFTRIGTTWSETALLVAPNAEVNDTFGDGIALSEDGLVLAVAAPREDSGAVGVDGDPFNNDAAGSGAVFVFQRSGPLWLPAGYLKASAARPGLQFGVDLSFSADGARLAIGAVGADSFTGAAYVFDRVGASWSQQAEILAAIRDPSDEFGWSVALAASGDTLVVGARSEQSGSADPLDNSKMAAGAAYVFVDRGGSWTQHAYLKASTVSELDSFGHTVAIVGTTILVGMTNEGTSGAVAVFDVAP